jgi:hypothetical protein
MRGSKWDFIDRRVVQSSVLPMSWIRQYKSLNDASSLQAIGWKCGVTKRNDARHILEFRITIQNGG